MSATHASTDCQILNIIDAERSLYLAVWSIVLRLTTRLCDTEDARFKEFWYLLKR